MKHIKLYRKLYSRISYIPNREQGTQMANGTHFGILLHFSVALFIEIKTMFIVHSEKYHHNLSVELWTPFWIKHYGIFCFSFLPAFGTFFPALHFKLLVLLRNQTNENIFEENNYREQNCMKLLQNNSLDFFFEGCLHHLRLY